MPRSIGLPIALGTREAVGQLRQRKIGFDPSVAAIANYPRLGVSRLNSRFGVPPNAMTLRSTPDPSAITWPRRRRREIWRRDSLGRLDRRLQPIQLWLRAIGRNACDARSGRALHTVNSFERDQPGRLGS